MNEFYVDAAGLNSVYNQLVRASGDASETLEYTRKHCDLSFSDVGLIMRLVSPHKHAYGEVTGALAQLKELAQGAGTQVNLAQHDYARTDQAAAARLDAGYPGAKDPAAVRGNLTQGRPDLQGYRSAFTDVAEPGSHLKNPEYAIGIEMWSINPMADLISPSAWLRQVSIWLLELVPGGAKKFLSTQQARALLNTVRPRDVVGKTRRWLASELIHELAVIDKKIKIANAELTELVETTGSTLQQLTGIGPSGAARLLGDIGDVGRFSSRGHFASWNGTAPIDASSGDNNRHRLSRAGNRRINRVLHIMAVVQLRRDTEGRRYYRRKLAAGKTAMEAMRALKRRLSDIVFRRMVADAKRLGTGPGGHVGATLQSSADDLIPMIDTSEKSLPGPAEPQPRTPILAGG